MMVFSLKTVKLFLWLVAGWRFQRRGKGLPRRLGSVLRHFSGRDTRNLKSFWTISEILHLHPLRCPTSMFNIRYAIDSSLRQNHG
jgi:hypothetical protein